MFCPKCGKEYEDRDLCCPYCGEINRGNQNNSNPIDEIFRTNNANENLPALPTKKRKKNLIIALVSVLVLLIGSAVAVMASPVLKNSFMKTVMSSKDYFRYVMKNNFDDTSKEVASAVGMITEKINFNEAEKGGISLYKGDGLNALLRNTKGIEIPAVLDWIDEISLEYETNVCDERVSALADIRLNGTSITEMNFIMDMSVPQYFIAFPDINPTYLTQAMSRADFDSESFNALAEILEALPDDETLQKILYKYGICAFNQFTKVEKTKDTIEAAGVSMKATKLTVEIGEEDILKAVKAVLQEMKNDKDIETIITDFANVGIINMDSSDLYSDFIKEIDSLIGQLKETEAEGNFGEECLYFSIWVDNKGNISGYEISFEEITVSLAKVTDGSQEGIKAELYAGQSIVFEGKGEKSGNKLNGEYVLSALSSEILEVNVNDLDLKALENNLFNGEITLKTADGANKLLALPLGSDVASVIEDLKLVISGEASSEDAAAFNIEIQYKDEECLGISVEYEKNESTKIDLPSDYVYIDNPSDTAEWVMNINPDKLINNMKSAGVPEEIVKYFEYYKNMLSMASGNYNEADMPLLGPGEAAELARGLEENELAGLL